MGDYNKVMLEFEGKMSLAYQKSDRSSLFVTKPAEDKSQVWRILFCFLSLNVFSSTTGEWVGPPWPGGATSGQHTAVSVPPTVETGGFTSQTASSGSLTTLSLSLASRYLGRYKYYKCFILMSSLLQSYPGSCLGHSLSHSVCPQFFTKIKVKTHLWAQCVAACS